MGWFNETHEGDNPESNTEKNTDNVEANSEEVDKKMDDFASKTEEGGEKSSFWDKLKSKFSKQETGGEGKDDSGETKEETETPSEEEQHESFVEYLRNPKNFQGSWDVGKKEKVEKTSGNGDAGENDEDPHGIPEREIGYEIPRYSKPEQSRDDDWER